MNQENAKKEEHKSSVFPADANSNNSPAINFSNLFKPPSTQSSGFPGFSNPQQGAADSNKPAASIIPSLSNQSNAAFNAQNTGFAGSAQTSASNANQKQQLNTFVPSNDSNAIPKFGFGQSSSLGAPIAAMVI